LRQADRSTFMWLKDNCGGEKKKRQGKKKKQRERGKSKDAAQRSAEGGRVT